MLMVKLTTLNVLARELRGTAVGIKLCETPESSQP